MNAFKKRREKFDHEWSDFVHQIERKSWARSGRFLSGQLVLRSAIYVMGPKSGSPIKVGYTDQPAQRIGQVQTGTWEEIRYHYVFWGSVEVTIEGIGSLEYRSHRLLEKHCERIRGEWFDARPDFAAWAIHEAAGDLRLVSHRELVKHFPQSKDPLRSYFWDEE